MKVQITIFFLIYSLTAICQDSLKTQLFPSLSPDNGMFGFVNSTKEFVIEPRYSTVTEFDNDGQSVVSLYTDSMEIFAVIDLKGNYIVSFDEGYELISLTTEFEDWILVIKNEKWGYINEKNEVLIPLIYQDLGDFYGGLAYAKKDNKFGFIDTNNTTIIDFKYKWALNFGSVQTDSLRYAPVEKGKKRGYINNKGELAIKCKYDFGYEFSNGVVPVKKGGKWGCINTERKVIVPFEYDLIQPIGDDNTIIARKEESFGINYCFNLQGEFLGTRPRE